MKRRDLLKAASVTITVMAMRPLSALAAKSATTPAKVPFDELSRMLRDHGAIVPEQ
jgi:hypothetical protein